jgi:L-threonylcarbamoyladenylate synthase
MTMDEIEHAAEYLHAGKRVTAPTESVHGLGADALNAQAVAGIYAAGGRAQRLRARY